MEIKTSDNDIWKSRNNSVFTKLYKIIYLIDTWPQLFKRWINHYPLDIAIGFAITHPVDSDLFGG